MKTLSTWPLKPTHRVLSYILCPPPPFPRQYWEKGCPSLLLTHMLTAINRLFTSPVPPGSSFFNMDLQYSILGYTSPLYIHTTHFCWHFLAWHLLGSHLAAPHWHLIIILWSSTIPNSLLLSHFQMKSSQSAAEVLVSHPYMLEFVQLLNFILFPLPQFSRFCSSLGFSSQVGLISVTDRTFGDK